MTQLVERVEYRNETLRSVLGGLRKMLKSRVPMDICESYADQPVTVITQGPERLDVILKSLSIQTGAYLRLYVGQHGERARPTFYCERGQGALLTLEDEHASGGHR